MQLTRIEKDRSSLLYEEGQLQKKQQLQEELRKQKQLAEKLKREAEAAKQQLEAEKEALKIQMLCLQIAGRIVTGDIVPTKDHQYLVKHDAALYGKALMMRIQKEDPEELEQLTEDEEDKVKKLDNNFSSNTEQTTIDEAIIDIKI